MDTSDISQFVLQVAWSTLTPYRLVTSGADGLARTWDIREACLKRYGGLIGKRPEYRCRLTQIDRRESLQNGTDHGENQEVSAPVALPPLPIRRNDEEDSGDVELPAPVIPLPPMIPLPLGADAVGGQNQVVAQGGDEDNDLGRFIANDTIDEGVKLISKLQHGASLDERMGGPGTRSRRAAVKVICVARCPHGGHFATGSDDGICRVWQDEDDAAVESVDCRLSTFPSSIMKETTRRARHSTRSK
jgi:WD40 repeat protein